MPAVLAAQSDGLVVLEEVVGTPLVQAIGQDDASGLELDQLVALLDALPASVLDLPRRPAWSDRAADYADAVAAAGVHAHRALAVGREVVARSRTVDLGPVVATHGDFHEGQLTVTRVGEGWRPSGLLDVYTVGPGHRVWRGGGASLGAGGSGRRRPRGAGRAHGGRAPVARSGRGARGVPGDVDG